MKKQKILISSFAILFIIFLMLVILSGCCVNQDLETTPTTYGQIMVDKPEVFTRERLILRRHQDIQWLEAKLAEELKFEFQGFEDVRLLSEMMTKFNASYNPMQEIIDSATMQNQLNELKLQSLLQELSILNAKAQTTEAKGKQDEKEEESGEEEVAETEESNEDKLDQIKADLEKTIDDRFSELNEAIKSITKQQPTSLLEPQPIKSGARPTGIELLRDQLAYREAIQASLREKELDDSHDLSGLTLYTFKFDIAVLPGENTKHFAKINLELEELKDIRIRERFFSKWKSQFKENVQNEAISLQKRWEMRQLTNKEKILLAQELDIQIISREEELKDFSENNTQEKVRINNEIQKYKYLLDNIDSVKSGNDDLIKNALCSLAMRKYEERLVYDSYYNENAEYVTDAKEEYIPVFEDPEKFYKYYIPIFRRGYKKEHLESYLGELAESSPEIRNTYVYSVEPKEYAQNISDVAASEKMRSLILGLGLVLPGLNLGLDHNQLNKSQQRLQAIKRKPLAVGFTNGTNKFGWILGPKFHIADDGTPTFTHSPVQYSFQALVVVPAWLEKITINGSYEWLNDDLSRQNSAIKLWKKPMCIQLPGDASILTELIHKTYLQQKPSISRNEQDILCHANKKARIIIRGRNLWRNPVVFIGTQKATDINILPDMKGLAVTFDKMEMPAKIGTSNPKVDLTVITSQGVSTLEDAVIILPEKADAKAEPVVRYESPSVVKGDFFKVYTSGMISDGLHKVQLRIWPVKEDPKEASDVEGEVLSSKGKEKVFQFKIGEKNKNFWRTDWNKNPEIAEMKASLVVQFFKNQIPQVIPKDGIKGSFIYFENEDNSKVELMSKKLEFSIKNGDVKEINSIELRIVKRTRFYKAFSNLYEALQKRFSLSFESDLSPGSPFNVPLDKTTDYVLEEKDEDLIISINALPDPESKWSKLIKMLKNEKITSFKLKLIYSGGKSLTVKEAIKKQRLE